MSDSLARRAVERLAESLHLDADIGAFRAEAARLTLDETTPAALVESIVDLAGRLQLVCLRRSHRRGELDESLADDQLPLVLVGTHGERPVVALLSAADRTRVAATILGRGEERSVVAERGEMASALGWDGELIAVLAPTSVARPAAHTGTPANPGRRLLDLVLEEKQHVSLVWLYAVLVGVFGLTLPLGVQAIIGLVSGGLILQPVVILIAFVVVGTLATGVLQILQLSVVETIQQRVFARLALEFSFRVPRLALERVLDVNLPEQMNRFFEILTIQKSLGKLLTETTAAVLSILFGLILLTFYHPYFTLFGILLGAGLYGIFRWSGPKGLETSMLESKYKYRAVHWLEETARAITAFKFAPSSTLALEGMDAHVGGYLKYRGKHFKVLVQQALSMVVFKTIITAGLLILGSVLVINRQISLGQFVASEIVIVIVLAGIEKLILSLSDVYDILTAVEKLGHVRDLPLERTGGLTLAAGARQGVAIDVRDLTYQYPGSGRTLHGCSVAIQPGERVAITGNEGSGKSTLLQVIAGLLPAYSGTLAWDGITVRDLDPAGSRASSGQYLSSTDLFDGTVEQNVSVGRVAVDALVVQRALRDVGLEEWVQSLPHGAATPLTNGGRSLPRAAAARLLLAQAIAGAPRLVLCDDFFAFLEHGARRAITALLTDRTRPWTVVAVSHDPEFLAACDRVIVLRDGHVHAVGDWASLRSDPFVRDVVPSGEAV
ncbi:MAG: ABC transporter ATP-binding protein/permease [Gemmatimonadaceae bacterium]|nr:ABC transporter ATP-binding protein/permease [Gemmatimonadaceae bacterium]